MKKTAIDKIIETNEGEIAKLQAINVALRNAQNESKRKRKVPTKLKEVARAEG